MFKAPSTMIWDHRKAVIQMEPRPRKDAWIQEGDFMRVRDEEKNNISSVVIFIIMLPYYNLWEEL